MIEAYYDGFRDRLVADYRNRNPRVVAALSFAGEALASARSILDVGCGIGWSTSHLRAAGAEVVGLDISPVLIETAREMFGGEFICADFLDWQPERTFDAVLLIDAYEHFPRAERHALHARIRDLEPDLVALTVPSPTAMQYARDHGIPLQPIDEDVTLDDLTVLARDLGGESDLAGELEEHLVSIWEPDDYRHVLVRR